MRIWNSQSDSEYLAWSASYVHRITANPARYGISDDDVTLLGVLQAEFAEKLFLAKRVETRSPQATIAKNEARRLLERAVRNLTGNPKMLLHQSTSNGFGFRTAA